ncbi:hypothetical protein ACFRCG_23845 [Embleya sp. NPDC056575]|uniref:hypothetical protein n=1 Tax=unclassified Embleya TaxID=2699296 RepID=UPI003687B58B
MNARGVIDLSVLLPGPSSAQVVLAKAIESAEAAEARRRAAQIAADRLAEGAEAEVRATREQAELIVSSARSSADVLRTDALAAAEVIRTDAAGYAKRLREDAESDTEQARLAVEAAHAEVERLQSQAAERASRQAELLARARAAAEAEAERLVQDARAEAERLVEDEREQARCVAALAAREIGMERSRLTGLNERLAADRAAFEAEMVARGRRGSFVTRALPWVALVAAICLTASGEFALFVALGFGAWSYAAPVCIDAYVVASFRARREVFPAVLVMIVANSISHLLPVGHPPVAVVVAVSALAPLILWRVHVLIHAGAHVASDPADAPLPDRDDDVLPGNEETAFDLDGKRLGADAEAGTGSTPAAVREATVPARREAVRKRAAQPSRKSSGKRAADPVGRRAHEDLVDELLAELTRKGTRMSYREAQTFLRVRFDDAKAALNEAYGRLAEAGVVVPTGLSVVPETSEEATR